MPDPEMCRDLTRVGRLPREAADIKTITRLPRGSLRDTSKRQRPQRRRLSLEPGPTIQTAHARHARSFWWIALLCLFACISPTTAALINFDNCLDKSILESDPLQLQFIPLDVSATFNLSDPLHPLNVTIYGNVSGTTDGSTYNYSPSDPEWTNSSSTYGKIWDLGETTNKYTTLLTEFDVLSYVPWNNGTPFCSTVNQGECPLAPAFDANRYAYVVGDVSWCDYFVLTQQLYLGATCERCDPSPSSMIWVLPIASRPSLPSSRSFSAMPPFLS